MASQDHMASREPSHAGGVKPSREAELRGLLARVEAATGPDREINRALAVSIGGYALERRGRDRQEWFYPTGKEWFHRSGSCPNYSGSLDAALALVERVLPGWKRAVEEAEEPETEGQRARPYWASYLRSPLEQAIATFYAEGETPALALIAAVLKALIAEAASPESGTTGVWTSQSPTPLSKTEVQS